ncbi:hypothetical protein T265_08453 [Opisthorchis viverrini]|uniref:Uncharacterized protein n=1 Tax=Opisthorchis viverrini TaxID=6198 RepID=A0A074ZDN1_OPIVI|nr:hypothetical protein T265_08453 [Opisthorchis viverrini]KER23727.1 hypothetical protein T265_08453 [Opisthorchis viverrini]
MLKYVECYSEEITLPRRMPSSKVETSQRMSNSDLEGSIKATTSKLSRTGHCRLPGWESRDGPHQWLETLSNMDQSRPQRRSSFSTPPPLYTRLTVLDLCINLPARACNAQLPTPPPIIGERNCGSYNQCTTSLWQRVKFTMLRCTPYYYVDQKPGNCALRTSKDFKCLTIDVFGALPESGGNTESAILKFVEWYSGEITHPR